MPRPLATMKSSMWQLLCFLSFVIYCCGFRPYFAEKLKLRFNTRKNSVAVVGDEKQKREAFLNELRTIKTELLATKQSTMAVPVPSRSSSFSGLISRFIASVLCNKLFTDYLRKMDEQLLDRLLLRYDTEIQIYQASIPSNDKERLTWLALWQIIRKTLRKIVLFPYLVWRQLVGKNIYSSLNAREVGGLEIEDVDIEIEYNHAFLGKWMCYEKNELSSSSPYTLNGKIDLRENGCMNMDIVNKDDNSDEILRPIDWISDDEMLTFEIVKSSGQQRVYKGSLVGNRVLGGVIYEVCNDLSSAEGVIIKPYKKTKFDEEDASCNILDGENSMNVYDECGRGYLKPIGHFQLERCECGVNVVS